MLLAAFQLANPAKYNDEYAANQVITYFYYALGSLLNMFNWGDQGFGMKYFYKMEKNWGFTGGAEADTADQDQDKTKTYDIIRLEYAHLDSILYIGQLFVVLKMATNIVITNVWFSYTCVLVLI